MTPLRSIAVLLLLTSGCSTETAEPPLVPATGTLTFRGNPVPGVELVFHPQDEGPGWMPVATTSVDGSFAASTRLPGDGVLPGRYKVTAVWKPVVDDNGDGPNKLPRKYSSPSTTPLEIVAGSTSSAPTTLALTD